MSNNKISTNMALNVIRKLVMAVFPLVTFLYASRILGVENIGKFNFAGSIVGYFSLIAGLGIFNYAVREGSVCRNDTQSFNDFASQIFSINLLSTLVSYILLALTIVFFETLQPYKVLIVLLSSQILLGTLGVEWIYTVFEDYLHITIRSIVISIVSIICLFIFVKDENDLLMYALISVISSFGSNIINLLFVGKHCKFRFTKNIDWKMHIRPIMVLFSMSLAITIYVCSDTTILGLISGDKEVGLYSASVKVYTFVNGLIGAAIAVGIPRVSFLISEKADDELRKVAGNIQAIILTFAIPAMIGIIMLRKEIILLIAGKEYLGAAPSLAILAVSMFFCSNAYFWGQCILVPFKKENSVFFITVICALVNIVLNIMFIPFWGAKAAALTTLVSESIAFIYCFLKGNKYIHLKASILLILKTISASIPIIFITVSLKNIIPNVVVFTSLSVVLSVISFIIVGALLRQEILYQNLYVMMKKLSSKFRIKG